MLWGNEKSTEYMSVCIHACFIGMYMYIYACNLHTRCSAHTYIHTYAPSRSGHPWPWPLGHAYRSCFHACLHTCLHTCRCRSPALAVLLEEVLEEEVAPQWQAVLLVCRSGLVQAACGLVSAIVCVCAWRYEITMNACMCSVRPHAILKYLYSTSQRNTCHLIWRQTRSPTS